jgi:hypothetical protein
VSAAAVETTRREWEESSARLDAGAAADRDRYLRLLEQVDLVVAELRKRVGQTFTLAELAEAYDDADRWARASLAEAGAPRGWPTTLALVVGAAFHQYARGASDYRP